MSNPFTQIINNISEHPLGFISVLWSAVWCYEWIAYEFGLQMSLQEGLKFYCAKEEILDRHKFCVYWDMLRYYPPDTCLTFFERVSYDLSFMMLRPLPSENELRTLIPKVSQHISHAKARAEERKKKGIAYPSIFFRSHFPMFLLTFTPPTVWFCFHYYIVTTLRK